MPDRPPLLRLLHLPLAVGLATSSAFSQEEASSPRAMAPAGSDPILATVELPPEYEATVFARPPEVNYPTFVKPTPNGPVFVAIDKNSSLDEEAGRGSVVACFDDDRDGVADRVTQFIPNIDSPRGLEWDGEWLYVMHTPFLSAFRDTDGDGIADESRVLIDGIGFDLSERPADHTSNGVTLGIDGWLYLAIGDFGFMRAEGADGRVEQLRGGGVVRVKTDGSDLEIFSRGTRNIYEVAIDPFLNGFARDNTNDGGGWDTRLHHFTGLDDHGYPSLYVNFNDEIVAPLADYGGGAGTGGHFLAEPGFPEGDNNRLYTVDWGRSAVFLHHLHQKGSTFEEIKVETFMTVERVTDMAVDGESHFYLASWAGGRYTYGGENVGYLLRVSPKDYAAPEVPEFTTTNASGLVYQLASPSATWRLMAQREILRRQGIDPSPMVKLASDRTQAPEARVAAIFTLIQLPDFDALPLLESLMSDQKIGHLAVRAMGNDSDDTDPRLNRPLQKALASGKPLLALEAIVAAARQNRLALAPAVLPLANHQDPLLSHTAINALAKLQASEASLASLDNPAIPPNGPLRALAKMHDESVVDSLIAKLNTDTSVALETAILGTLSRLAYKEGEWQGDSWGTRPDTRGPYYQREQWAATKKIVNTLHDALAAPETDKPALLESMAMNRLISSDQLPKIRSLAKADPELEVPYLKSVLDVGPPTPEAINFIASIAASQERSLEARALASRCLLSQSDPAAARVGFLALEQVARRARTSKIERLVGDALTTLLASERLPGWLDWLLEQTNSEQELAREMAWAALLNARHAKEAQQSTRSRIDTAIQDSSDSDLQRVALLDAVAKHRIREASDIVVASSKSDNPAILQSARKAAKVLRISLDSSKTAGPKIAEMKQQQVLEKITAMPGDPAEGEALFARQNCSLCHTVDSSEALKGPYLGNIASMFNRHELAIAIMDPNDTIAQGFVTNVVTLRDGSMVSGFVTFESSEVVELRDVTGVARRVDTKDIERRDHLTVSMMPPGLVSNISPQELASLIAYLEKLAD